MSFGQYKSDYERLDQFVRNHMVEFSKFAVYVVHDYDIAQDGIQNAMEAIMKYYDSVRDFEEQRLYRYCLAIIKHECIRVASAQKNMVSYEDVEYLEEVPDDMLDNIIRDADNALLKACIEELPEKFKLAILMKYFYQQSDRDIARAIDISDASVRMILTRGRNKLKEIYIKKAGEEVSR